MTGQRVGDVVIAADGPVVRATIDRPEARNAISPSVTEGLESAVRMAREIGARVLVLRGAAGTFCAGADLEWVLSSVDQPGALEDDPGPQPVAAAVGAMISGREAAEWGLVTRAVPPEQLDEVAESMIARLASRSAAAIAGMKDMIGTVRDIPVPDGIDAERRIFTEHMAKSDDMRAALARFLQPKEKP